MTLTEQILSTLPGDMLGGLRRADDLWYKLRHQQLSVPTVVQTSQEPLAAVDWDVVICGGTLGIFIGAALAQQGWRVALIERGALRGREQEWNISRQELQVFLELNLLTEPELEQAIAIEYNPARISFSGSSDLWVRDILNVGIDPIFLLDKLKARFLANGGKLLEHTGFAGAIAHPNGVTVKAGQDLKARLLIDAMGHFSPIVQQARQGQPPDGICLVVGTCAQGFPKNDSGDLLVSFTPIQNQCQYFWEAFPARDGRTTYLFTYLDAHRDRFSLETLFEEYFRLLPEYQQIELSQLQFQRALFGLFPCYQNSPLQPSWNHVLHVGDSSGSQSPLSFGGFGAMVRHLERLSLGIHEALTSNALDRQALALLQPYQPNVSVTWLFQKAMSVGMHQQVNPNQINQLLADVFQEMAQLGEPVLRPFLQDVVQFSALSRTLLQTSLAHPSLVAKIVPQVGLPALLNWTRHFGGLALYSALYPLGHAIAPWTKRWSPTQKYYFQRWLQAWQYGAGGDYKGSN
ncbi:MULTISPECIES: NAD(P)/FAD-dependent oxidoreductase [Trichocoleus]|uniref:FAD-binding oxidoreductase n=1 Tax=Trichocoleus desertorum GB2-A4 TaxID=2933944 RepID=A0ABV0JED8_9CYAN|nr:FAD-binding oxidoreductase [Trichocoleus sp. FACHB-46]MBD1862747.1 FAD-binding oxidoreductase [Trichocoleus sp. FACHB-46]